MFFTNDEPSAVSERRRSRSEDAGLDKPVEPFNELRRKGDRNNCRSLLIPLRSLYDCMSISRRSKRYSPDLEDAVANSQATRRMTDAPSLFSTQVRPDTEYFRTTYYPKTGAAAPSASDIFEMHPSLLYFHLLSALVVVLVEHVTTHVHSVTHDLDGDVLGQIVGDTPPSNRMRIHGFWTLPREPLGTVRAGFVPETRCGY